MRTTKPIRVIPIRRSAACLLIAALCSSQALAAQGYPKLDETWTVTVNGQSVTANADGSFTLPNISAADQFGAGGPGSRPDFVSDDFMRLIATSTSGGVTKYAFSEFFQIRRGRTYVIGALTFTDTPPSSVDSLSVAPDKALLTALAQTTQVRVTATLSDGSSADVSKRTQWTIYRTSNPKIVSIGPDGLATAVGAGLAYITASNQGATAVTRVQVVPGDPLTTVVGFATLQNGNPVAGATVTVAGTVSSGLTKADGSFSLSGVPTLLGPIKVQANFKPTTGKSLAGSSDPVEPVPNGLTGVGVVVLEPVTTEIMTFGLGAVSQNYTEKGMRVRSAYPFAAHLHFRSGGLFIHSSCCSTPYIFQLVSGGTFGVVEMTVVGSFFGTQRFTTSTGKSFVVTKSGKVTFPSGFDKMTSLRWDGGGSMTIDNLVIQK